MRGGDARLATAYDLGRSFERYDSRCSLRTWVYRVAHHVGAWSVRRERRVSARLVSLEAMEATADTQPSADERVNLDRQMIVSYLEDMDAASIGEITGLTPGNVAMRIHRIKKILARRSHERGNHAD